MPERSRRGRVALVCAFQSPGLLHRLAVVAISLLCVLVHLTLAPSLGAQSLEDAATQLQAGHVDEAVATLRVVGEEALAADPELAAIAWNNACVLESDRGRFREALTDCERALEARTELDDWVEETLLVPWEDKLPADPWEEAAVAERLDLVHRGAGGSVQIWKPGVYM